MVFIFNIQGSLYGPEYYINVGIYIKALGDLGQPYEYDCHIRARLNREQNPEQIYIDSKEWFAKYDSINSLKKASKNKELPIDTVLVAREYIMNLLKVENKE